MDAAQFRAGGTSQRGLERGVGVLAATEADAANDGGESDDVADAVSRRRRATLGTPRP